MLQLCSACYKTTRQAVVPAGPDAIPYVGLLQVGEIKRKVLRRSLQDCVDETGMGGEA